MLKWISLHFAHYVTPYIGIVEYLLICYRKLLYLHYRHFCGPFFFYFAGLPGFAEGVGAKYYFILHQPKELRYALKSKPFARNASRFTGEM